MRKSMARRGSLLLSVLAVVLSAALIAGATYALFSQRDSYDIEVSSGDIKVTGELAITGAWSQGENAAARTDGAEQEDGSYLVEQGGVFRTDGSKIVMTNISQGDGATYRLSLTNESSVSMQYRVYIEAEESNALTEALELKADGAEITLEGGTATLVGWTQVNAGAALADGELEIEISLPWGNDDAAGQIANLNVVVEAIQANAVPKHSWSEEYYEDSGSVYKRQVCEECGEHGESVLVEKAVVLTADDYNGKIKIGDDGDGYVYFFKAGEYGSIGIYPHGAENITFLAEEGVVINGTLTIGYHSNQDANNPIKTDSTLSVIGFTVKGEMRVNVADQHAYISNNAASQITVKTYKVENIDIVVENNITDGNLGSSNQKYGMFIVPNVTGYDFTARNNVFRNLESHCIVIQGGGDGGAKTAANSVVLENNVFESYGLVKEERAAFKIWADTKYAPEELDWISNTTNDLTDDAKELVGQILAGNNTFAEAKEGENKRYKFDFYGLYFDEL